MQKLMNNFLGNDLFKENKTLNNNGYIYSGNLIIGSFEEKRNIVITIVQINNSVLFLRLSFRKKDTVSIQIKQNLSLYFKFLY